MNEIVTYSGALLARGQGVITLYLSGYTKRSMVPMLKMSDSTLPTKCLIVTIQVHG